MTKEKCTVCNKDVVWEQVIEEMEYLFEQVDMYGELSLTESEQIVYRGKICSYNCYQYL